MVLLDEIENLRTVEAVVVIDQLAALHEPLTVELAPRALCPTRVGHRHVAALGVNTVPVLGGAEVRGGVVVAVQGHLGLTRGTAGEVNQEGVARAVVDAAQLIGCQADARAHIHPAFTLAGSTKEPVGAAQGGTIELLVNDGALRVRQVGLGAVDHEQRNVAPQLRDGLIDLVRDGADRIGDDGGEVSSLDAVRDVVRLEHEGRRDNHGANLAERQRHDPERVVATHDDHDAVPALDSLRKEEVSRLVGPPRDVREAQVMLLALGIAPNHGHALRLDAANLVDDVVGVVEMIAAAGAEGSQVALGVKRLDAVALVNVEHGCASP